MHACQLVQQVLVVQVVQDHFIQPQQQQLDLKIKVVEAEAVEVLLLPKLVLSVVQE